MSSSSQQVPVSVRALRAWLGLLGGLAPRAAGRSAADVFTRTRPFKPRGDARSLGAKPLTLPGKVTQAHAWGEGPTVLLVHGWGSDSSALFGLARVLAARGLRAITFDAPGHGRSPEARSTLTELTRSLGDLLDALGKLSAVVGHSLGGMATVGAVTASPSRRPERLVLVSAPSRLEGVLEGFSDFMRLSPPVVENMRAELLRRNGVPVEYWNMASLGRGLEVPTLVLHDRSDTFVPFAQADGVVQALSASRLEVTTGLGHRRITGDPGVHQTIADFLGPPPAT